MKHKDVSSKRGPLKPVCKYLPMLLLASGIAVKYPNIRIVESSWGSRNKDIVIAQISDLHIGKRIRPVHRKTARILNRLNPDVLVITGDSVGHSRSLPVLASWLETVNIAQGRRFAVPGNWEYDRVGDMNALREMYKARDVALLINEYHDLTIRGQAIRITGLDDLLFGNPDFSLPGLADRGREENLAEIILVHEPQAVDYFDGRVAGATVLSGHTHGGQITLFGKALYTPSGSGPYVSGFYEVDGNRLFVSKGIGTSTLNLRIGAEPDMLLLRSGLPEKE